MGDTKKEDLSKIAKLIDQLKEADKNDSGTEKVISVLREEINLSTDKAQLLSLLPTGNFKADSVIKKSQNLEDENNLIAIISCEDEQYAAETLSYLNSKIENGAVLLTVETEYENTTLKDVKLKKIKTGKSSSIIGSLLTLLSKNHNYSFTFDAISRGRTFGDKAEEKKEISVKLIRISDIKRKELVISLPEIKEEKDKSTVDAIVKTYLSGDKDLAKNRLNSLGLSLDDRITYAERYAHVINKKPDVIGLFVTEKEEQKPQTIARFLKNELLAYIGIEGLAKIAQTKSLFFEAKVKIGDIGGEESFKAGFLDQSNIDLKPTSGSYHTQESQWIYDHLIKPKNTKISFDYSPIEEAICKNYAGGLTLKIWVRVRDAIVRKDSNSCSLVLEINNALTPSITLTLGSVFKQANFEYNKEKRTQSHSEAIWRSYLYRKEVHKLSDDKAYTLFPDRPMWVGAASKNFNCASYSLRMSEARVSNLPKLFSLAYETLEQKIQDHYKSQRTIEVVTNGKTKKVKNQGLTIRAKLEVLDTYFKYSNDVKINSAHDETTKGAVITVEISNGEIKYEPKVFNVYKKYWEKNSDFVYNSPVQEQDIESELKQEEDNSDSVLTAHVYAQEPELEQSILSKNELSLLLEDVEADKYPEVIAKVIKNAIQSRPTFVDNKELYEVVLAGTYDYKNMFPLDKTTGLNWGNGENILGVTFLKSEISEQMCSLISSEIETSIALSAYKIKNSPMEMIGFFVGDIITKVLIKATNDTLRTKGIGCYIYTNSLLKYARLSGDIVEKIIKLSAANNDEITSVEFRKEGSATQGEGQKENYVFYFDGVKISFEGGKNYWSFKEVTVFDEELALSVKDSLNRAIKIFSKTLKNIDLNRGDLGVSDIKLKVGDAIAKFESAFVFVMDAVNRKLYVDSMYRYFEVKIKTSAGGQASEVDKIVYVKYKVNSGVEISEHIHRVIDYDISSALDKKVQRSFIETSSNVHLILQDIIGEIKALRNSGYVGHSFKQSDLSMVERSIGKLEKLESSLLDVKNNGLANISKSKAKYNIIDIKQEIVNASNILRGKLETVKKTDEILNKQLVSLNKAINESCSIHVPEVDPHKKANVSRLSYIDLSSDNTLFTEEVRSNQILTLALSNPPVSTTQSGNIQTQTPVSATFG